MLEWFEKLASLHGLRTSSVRNAPHTCRSLTAPQVLPPRLIYLMALCDGTTPGFWAGLAIALLAQAAKGSVLSPQGGTNCPQGQGR